MGITDMRRIKYFIPIFIIILILFLIGKKFWFLRVYINEIYYIQQKPFTNNYILISKKNGHILEHIYEWLDVNEYIYGSGYNDKDFYYLYEKKKNTVIIYEDLHSFYEKLNAINLKYTMDNCTRIIDYKLIN